MVNMGDEGNGRHSGVSHPPVLPGPIPVFDEDLLGDVFAEGKRDDDFEMGMDSAAERRPDGEEKNEDKGLEDGEGGRKERQEDELLEGAEIFEGSEKEVLDLFLDGDIENW